MTSEVAEHTIWYGSDAIAAEAESHDRERSREPACVDTKGIVLVDLEAPQSWPRASRDLGVDDEGTSILPHVDAAARRDTNAIALVGHDTSLRYGTLAALMRRVGRHVTAVVPAGAPVATILPQTPHAIAALFGCAASGRTVVVINPADPPDRRAALLADAAPAAVVGDPDALPPGVVPAGVAVIRTDALEALPDGADWAPAAAAPDDPAAVHFTSGSTGDSKGIVSSARGIMFRARTCIDGWALTASDRLVFASLPTTSASYAFYLAGLRVGATVLVVDIGRDGATRLLNLARAQRVTIGAFNPVVFRALMRLPGADSAFANLRVLRLGGSGVPPADVAAWRARLPGDCIINHAFASTEAGVMAEWIVPPDFTTDAALLPVGRLSPAQTFALLDPAGAPVPDGELGELVVRSRYVALGEWRAGRLVTGRMSPDPAHPGWRIFRTGDLVWRDADGLISFGHRNDRQIKINGVRIEPAALEAALREDPRVADAVVVARQIEDGPALDAFVAAPGCEPATLRGELLKHLADKLPRRLRPTRLIVVDVFPALPSGKIDVQALRRGASESDA
jgi:acyl-coenzyme A synthetase/AMP-(fatty) acid ligase